MNWLISPPPLFLTFCFQKGLTFFKFNLHNNDSLGVLFEMYAMVGNRSEFPKIEIYEFDIKNLIMNE